jgi:hypothetical protein
VGRFEFGGEFGEALAPAGHEHEIGSAACEFAREGRAYAGAGAGDDGGLA